MLSIVRLDGYDPAHNLAREEALFDSLRAEPRPVALFYVNDPCVVLGRSNAEAQWVDAAACAADGVPVLRRFTGGGTVYHDRDNLNFSFILPRGLLDALGAQPSAAADDSLAAQPSAAVHSASTGIHGYIDFFRGMIIRALSRGGGGYSAGGISDVLLNGGKVSGNAQRVAGGLVLHHGTLMLRCPLGAIERYLPVPPNRRGVPHRGFVTGLHEQGRPHTLEEVADWLADEFARTLDSA